MNSKHKATLAALILAGVFAARTATTYDHVNCSQLVSMVEGTNCTAAQFATYCDGRHAVVPQAEAKLGDVVAFNNGAHVAIYVTRNVVLDSTPEHGVMVHKVPAGDPWYAAPKILRKL